MIFVIYQEKEVLVECNDKIVESVVSDLRNRSKKGFTKYGTTLERKDLTQKEWLQHAYEEALDLANYLKKLIIEDE